MPRLLTTVVATFAVVAAVAWLLSRTVSVTDDGSVAQSITAAGANARTVHLVLDVPDKEDRYVITRTTDVPRAIFHAHLADRTADMAGGSDVPLIVRPIPALTPTFYVPEMGVRGGTLEIDETGGQPGEYRVLTVADFEAEQSTARVLFGLYFGLLLAVGVYHVLMFAVLGGLDFLTYGLYMGALLLQEIARTEYVDVLLPGTTVDHHAAFMLSIALLAVAGYAFFNTFLRLARTQPVLNRVLAAFAAIEVLAAVAAARLGDARLDGAVVAFAFVTLAVGLAGAVRALSLGERSARFLLLAYSGFAIGLTATVLRRFVPGLPEWTGLGFELGTAFEALTLALGVGDRIVRANEERDQARIGSLEEQRTLTVAYARFVPEAFLHMLGKTDVRMVELGDRASRRTTVLFTDVRSFSTLSESMEPEETFGFVNELLSRTGPIIRAHNGIVDKYIGDAIMALFPGGPQEALAAAFAMQGEIAQLNRERERTGHEPIAMGIGVHVGDVVLGIVGEIERMDGTAIGDAVNLASRLEGLTKIYGSTIIISNDAADELAAAERDDLRYLGRIAVKGKSVPVGLFEALAAETPEQRDEKLRTRPMFEAGIEALTRGDFGLAAQCFDAVIIDNPMDGPATHLAERSRELELRPEHGPGSITPWRSERMYLRLAILCALVAFAAPAGVRADSCQARFSNAPCYLGAPNLKLARSFVDGAGGIGHTSTMTLLALLAGSRLPSVQAAMESKYGKDAFADFVTASDFAMQDGAETLAALHFTLPAAGAPSPKDGKALFAALWSAGLYGKGSYDYEYMLDRMLGHATHAKVMDDIDTKYGKKFDAYYHVIFNAVMENIDGAK